MLCITIFAVEMGLARLVSKSGFVLSVLEGILARIGKN
jgi:hypothetical protein